MNEEALDNEKQPKSMKPSEEVIKEIVSNAAESDASVMGRAAKDDEGWLLRLQQLERLSGLKGGSTSVSNERDEDEKQQLQLVKQQELRKLVAEADKMVQDNEGRRRFSWAIFYVMVAWMLSVLLIIMLCATGHWQLSDSVLIALITTTTATVIGVFVVVANYLFNREKST